MWVNAYSGKTLLGCMALARRKFFEAKTSNAQLSYEVLELFGKVYAVEKHIREHNLPGEAKLAYRLEHPIVTLEALHA
jgi:transposase